MPDRTVLQKLPSAPIAAELVEPEVKEVVAEVTRLANLRGVENQLATPLRTR